MKNKQREAQKQRLAREIVWGKTPFEEKQRALDSAASVLRLIEADLGEGTMQKLIDKINEPLEDDV